MKSVMEEVTGALTRCWLCQKILVNFVAAFVTLEPIAATPSFFRYILISCFHNFAVTLMTFCNFVGILWIRPSVTLVRVFHAPDIPALGRHDHHFISC